MAGVVWQTACSADIGGREEQQDRVAIFERGGAQLLVLADGMGGHEGGALAAQAVVDVARERFDAVVTGNPTDLLVSIALGSHEIINAIGAERGMSPHSTCVLLHLTETVATWAHVGDSRFYRIDDGRFVDRSIDHSVVELMRLQGRITEQEMKAHPDQNRLYEALGGEKPPEVGTGRVDVSERDGFLLASDGLWENISDSELEAVFEAENVAQALRLLVERAKKKGGPECDNISVAVARRCQAIPSIFRRLCRAFGLRWSRRPQ